MVITEVIVGPSELNRPNSSVSLVIEETLGTNVISIPWLFAKVPFASRVIIGAKTLSIMTFR